MQSSFDLVGMMDCPHKDASSRSLGSPLSMIGSNYNGDVFAGLPAVKKEAQAPSVLALLGFWILFVVNRAMHPLVIDLSKGPDGIMHYQKLTPVIAKCFVSVLACNVFAVFDRDGWKAGLGKCYRADSLRVFGAIGALYALGDFLEMTSMASMDGAAYQVLLQSKLIITAFLMWAIKGRSAQQSASQWSVLVTVTIGMTLFMMVQQEAGSGSKKGGKSSGLLGTAFVLAKVLVSCYSAVKADQTLKRFNSLPLYAQLSQLMSTWGVVSMAMAFVLEPAIVSSPTAFFQGWNYATVLVALSFSAKTVLTMSLLKMLDSVQKNIGEAVAMLVIYLGQVLLPIFSKEFETNTFLAMLVVVMSVTTYMLVGKEEKVRKERLDRVTDQRASPDAKCKPRPPQSMV